jgi:Winged helix-turn helix
VAICCRHVISMTSRIFLAPHHSTEELERRYKAADGGVERGHLHIIWLLSRSAKFVAEVTGYTPTSKILWRYNDHGLAGLGAWTIPAPPRCLTRLNWRSCATWSASRRPTAGSVACWISGRSTVSPQRGVEYLRRLDLTRQVPRPANPKASLYEQARFKKSSRSASSKAPTRRSRSKSGRSMNTASA